MWKYSGCQVCGRGHTESGTPCQDRTKFGFMNGAYFIALADGAGSAALSHYGAERVTDTVSRVMTLRFDEFFAETDGERVKSGILNGVTDALKLEAEERGCSLDDLASTMLAVAVKDQRFIIVHVGDGVIGYLDGETLKVASAPSNGEHVNETYFVSSPVALGKMKIFKGNIRDICGFVLMSDGTEQSLYDKRNNALSSVITKLLQRNLLIAEPVMKQQLEQTFANVVIQRTRDDCSIALMSRPHGALKSLRELSLTERGELYGKKPGVRFSKKKLDRYEQIVKILQTPSRSVTVAQKLRLEQRYAKRYLNQMLANGLIQYDNGYYHL